MSDRSAGGLVLLLIGSLGLVGYLTGNLDRWLAFLFTPGGVASSSAGAAPTAAAPPAAASVAAGRAS